MKPTRWRGENNPEFGPNLELYFGDFHQISVDNEGVDLVMYSRQGFVVWEKKLGWDELFAVVFGQPGDNGGEETVEES